MDEILSVNKRLNGFSDTEQSYNTNSLVRVLNTSDINTRCETSVSVLYVFHINIKL